MRDLFKMLRFIRLREIGIQKQNLFQARQKLYHFIQLNYRFKVRTNQKVASSWNECQLFEFEIRNIFREFEVCWSWWSCGIRSLFIKLCNSKILNKTETKISNTYVFQSTEILFEFTVGHYRNRISIFLKKDGVIDKQCYFWTEDEIGRAIDLLKVLKIILQ